MKYHFLFNWRLKRGFLMDTCLLSFFIVAVTFSPEPQRTFKLAETKAEWNVNIRLAMNCEPKLHRTKFLIKFQLDWIDWNNIIHSWIHLLVNGKSPKHEERGNVDSIFKNSILLSKAMSSNIYLWMFKTVIHFYIGNDNPVRAK